MRRFDNVNYRQWLERATSKLQKASIDSAKLDANLLLAYGISKSREYIITHEDEILSDKQTEYLEAMLSKRLSRTPLAYIAGTKEFYGREFITTPDTLIPRPESEAIIDMLAGIYETYSGTDMWLYDIGTGTGCLAITAKLEFPKLHVIGSDTSEAALLIAKKNAMRHDATIDFVLSNLLSDLTFEQRSLVVANLPYVPNGMITSPEVTKEPAEALFSGIDGLNHYRRFWQQLQGRSHTPLEVVTESLVSQHNSLESLATNAGYTLVENKDLIQRFQKITEPDSGLRAQ